MKDITKITIKDLEPLIKEVGSWNNARIARAIVTTGYRNTVLEDIHANKKPISNRIRKEITYELANCIDFACLMQPLIEHDSIEDIEDLIVKGHEEDVRLGIIKYLSDMVFGDGCSTEWDDPHEVDDAIFDELDDKLCYMDRELWPQAIAEFVLDGQFSINAKKKVRLNDNDMKIMNKDVHNRMFTVLERLGDVMYGYYG